MGKQDRNNLFILILVWIEVEFLVNPIGNFPLNDDWAYGFTVKHLLQKGIFVLSDWTATNLFSQAFWGALFCMPFGFSFTALRISTVVIAGIGLASTYFLLRETDANPTICLIATLVMALNPIYLALSNTFMNDVPSLSFLTIACLLMIRSLKSDSWFLFAVAIAASCIAVLARQTGLAIALAFACTWILKGRISKNSLLKAILSIAVPFAVEITYIQWLQKADAGSFFLGDQIDTIFTEASAGFLMLVSNFGQITIYTLIYVGLFAAPILIPFRSFIGKNTPSTGRNWKIFITASVLVLFVTVVIAQHKWMPFLGNILVDFGIGPLGLENTYQPKAPRIFWYLVTCFGVFTSILGVQLFISFIRSVLRKEPASETGSRWFILLCFLFLFLPLAGLGLSWRGVYDRYLLPLLPFAFFMALAFLKNIDLSVIQQKALRASLAILILYGGFAVAGTHDYLAANRVVWKGLHELMDQEGIAPQQIRGGFEFYGWYLCKDRNRTSKRKEVAFACLWSNDQADYVLSFLPIEGYQELKRYPFSIWLIPDTAELYVLHTGPGIAFRN